jgi:hypothetical protein
MFRPSRLRVTVWIAVVGGPALEVMQKCAVRPTMK